MFHPFVGKLSTISGQRTEFSQGSGNIMHHICYLQLGNLSFWESYLQDLEKFT